jgi:hypothetical protein
MQRDPIGTWIDRSNLGNPFAYVGDNALNKRDPYGLDGGATLAGIALFDPEPITKTVAAVGAIVVAVGTAVAVEKTIESLNVNKPKKQSTGRESNRERDERGRARRLAEKRRKLEKLIRQKARKDEIEKCQKDIDDLLYEIAEARWHTNNHIW